MIKYILMDKRFLLLLFTINFLGTIYGYYWYRSQLSLTPDIFLVFVPDSPTASLFFTIVFVFFCLIKIYLILKRLLLLHYLNTVCGRSL